MAQTIKTSLEAAIKKRNGRRIIMMEIPAESYFEANINSIRTLLKKGFEGVYISFQRPFNNVYSLLKQYGVNADKLLFIDIASAFAQQAQENHPRVTHVSSAIDVDEMVRAVYTSLQRLKSKKRFIFIDSMSTIALYKPLSETMRFSEFLIRTIKHEYPGAKEVFLIFNVAKDLAQKRFIRDIALRADEIVGG